MQRKTKISLVVAALLVASAFLNVYYVADGSAVTVYSRGEEAYLFLGDWHLGYRVRYLAFPFVVLRQYFNAPIEPTEKSGCSMVTRVTPSEVDRRVTQCGDPNLQYVLFVTPFDGGFYAMCRGSILCKWTENGFAPATDEEARRIGGLNSLARSDMNNQTVNGWQVHSAAMPGDRFEVAIGKDIVLSVRNHATNARELPWITVDLIRARRAYTT